MSQKSSVPQAVKFVSQALKRDILAAQPGYLLYANTPEGDELHPDYLDKSFWPKRAPPGLH